MLSLFLTLAVVTVTIVTCQGVMWILFKRKMEPLRFPSKRDPFGSHFYYLERVRLGMLLYTSMLIICFWIFFIALW